MRSDSPLPLRIDTDSNPPSSYNSSGNLNRADDKVRSVARRSNPRASIHLVRERISPWCQSAAKRVFDCACILPVLPLLIPILLLIGLAVRLTSRGPVLFLQKRVGRLGRMFTIVKFRTLEHRRSGGHNAVTTVGNQSFTPVGPFLRKWKLDELPQLWNVLIGDMSLVGPRPKLAEHQLTEVPCRPGITGAATLAFAREEAVLAELPNHNLDECYREIILPAKHRIDQDYMGRATFFSDLGLLIKTITRQWDTTLMEHVLREVLDGEQVPARETRIVHARVAAHERELMQEEQFTEA